MDPFGKQTARRQFDRFVAAQSRSLLTTATLLTWDLGEAEDIVQECLLRVARQWPRVTRMEHPQAYARRVLVNLAIDGRDRRARRVLELAGSDAQPAAGRDAARDGRAHSTDADARVELLGTREQLLGAIATLPPRQRAMLVLRFFEDLSEAQTAELLGCSVGTVKSTTSRGLERLRAALGDGCRADASTATTRSAHR